MLRLNDEYELLLNGERAETDERTNDNFTRQLEEFADAIREGREPLASGREIVGVMKVIDGCFESMRSKEVVWLNV
jgi:predicted dehydrogenase